MWAGYWSNRLLQMKRAGVHVTARKLRYRKEEVIDTAGNVTTVTTPQEKGIDVRLALDVVSTARTRQWQVPDGPNATSRRGIDKTMWFRMDQAFYDACLDPADYRPKRLRP